ncbi:unnamed protein product [Allacma fusca]|uniref:Uncharacterized protein n=1 Tax=Allacma fusca TaxID=39272 RepID=A0A8J2NGN3_9HEXA|nr:unnamed protein product [Allacma fusca]
MPKDPLCPLGFHPQTRWPTRCKRCFREYKEHAPKNDDKKDLSSRHDLEFRRRTPFPEDIPTSSSDSRSRSSAVSSNISSRQSNTDSPSSKDFSTPYSSISSEAQIRLNRLREASAERKAATTDNLLTPATAESTSSYHKAPATKTPASSITHTNNAPKEMPTPPGRRKILPQSSLPEETVTLRLGSRSNSFNLSDNSNSSRESSVSPSPVPPRRAKTPSLEETTKEPPVTKVQLKLPKVKVSDSSDDAREQEKDDTKPKRLKKKRLLIQGVQEVMPQSSPDESDGSSENSDAQSADVAFIIQVRFGPNGDGVVLEY